MPITPEKVLRALEEKYMEEDDDNDQLVAGA
jgi:hypothetical protein